ncbi:DnaJ-domain-containing protein [Westerdykella ornata]|uniref:DnaJ-domain-containing protein n=1 Tax=Westerdykella ornata TaxID=318751 RepID=A0A6A6J6P9_WESOR|nr:DnaJ-domain-containing protein [Westerdykella ornata]KAF2271887.1 DnaJ-domain-containing protein [Westerdykella ornata]
MSPTAPPTEPTTRDYYADLGIPFTASTAAIRRAYHRRAQETHPDKIAPGQTIDAVEFRQVQTAYSVLSSPIQRLFYDNEYAYVAQQWAEYRASVLLWQQDEERRRREVEMEREKASAIATRTKEEAEGRERLGAVFAAGDNGVGELGEGFGQEKNGERDEEDEKEGEVENGEEKEGEEEEEEEEEEEDKEEEEEEEGDTSDWNQGAWVNWEIRQHVKNASVLGYFPTEAELRQVSKEEGTYLSYTAALDTRR